MQTTVLTKLVCLLDLFLFRFSQLEDDRSMLNIQLGLRERKEYIRERQYVEAAMKKKKKKAKATQLSTSNSQQQ